MVNLDNRTHTVLSIDSSQLNSEWLQQFLELKPNGIRILYHQEFSKQIIEFSNEFKQQQLERKLHTPVIIDFAHSQSKSQENNYLEDEIIHKTHCDYVIFPETNDLELLAQHKTQLLEKFRTRPWLLLQANGKTIQQVQETLNLVDGFYVSRADLADSINPALVPMAFKELAHECHKRAKLVMVASDILASMKTKTTPTRAEVSDIANATIDGVDCVVISEEVIPGEYWQSAYQLCKKIIRDVETNLHLETVNWDKAALKAESILQTVTFHAFQTARRVEAKAIVCLTKAGNTARRLSSYRSDIPIIAATFTQDVQMRLSLVQGVHPILLSLDPNLDHVLPRVSEELKASSWIKTGDKIVFVTVSISSVGKEASNLFTVQQIE